MKTKDSYSFFDNLETYFVYVYNKIYLIKVQYVDILQPIFLKNLIFINWKNFFKIWKTSVWLRSSGQFLVTQDSIFCSKSGNPVVRRPKIKQVVS